MQNFRVPYRTRFLNNQGFVCLHSARPKFFAFCRINELTCAYMYSQAQVHATEQNTQHLKKRHGDFIVVLDREFYIRTSIQSAVKCF